MSFPNLRILKSQEDEMQTGLTNLSASFTRAPHAASSLMEYSDEELIVEAKGGSISAFEKLVVRYQGRIFRIAQKIARSREDAEEIAQSAFVQAFRNLSKFRGDSRFSTWLTSITVNESLMKIRRRRQNVISIDDSLETGGGALAHEIADGGPTPEKEYSQEEVRKILAATIGKLSPQYRQVVQLRDVQGLSIVQTATVLELSLPAVKTRLQRARIQLRKSLCRRFRSMAGNRTAGSKSVSFGLLGCFLAVFVLSTVLVGCERSVSSAPAPPPPVVEVAPVTQKDVPLEGEWVGTLEGYVNAQIQPHVSGYLIRQDYHEGGSVRQGQVLFEIDPRPFQAALDQAKGQLAQAQAQLANAELNVNRDVPEAEAHAIPQSQLDNDTQAQLGAKAAVEAAQAAVEEASLNLGYTKVLSLIDGIAGINTVQVGNLVGPTTVLTAVSQVSPIKVYFPISEQEYLRLADGAGTGSVDWLSHASQIPLHLKLADGSAYPHPGRIVFADRQVNTETGTIQIVGEFPNPKKLMRPGQYALIEAPTGSITGALLVPQAAVNQQQGTYQVTVIGSDNRARLRTVEVGPKVGTLWVISSGLKPGERVAAVGAEKAKEGDLVNPTPYKETEER
jgi:RND family efflux transporter MFP subunit